MNRPLKKKPIRRRPTNCESCVNYVYDDDLDAYVCRVDLDEDEMERFARYTCENCPI